MGGCLETGIGNCCWFSWHEQEESIETDSTLLQDTRVSGAEGSPGCRSVADVCKGGIGEEEDEGEGQTPTGKVYEHWQVERPPRVRSSRIAENVIFNISSKIIISD